MTTGMNTVYQYSLNTASDTHGVALFISREDICRIRQRKYTPFDIVCRDSLVLYLERTADRICLRVCV